MPKQHKINIFALKVELNAATYELTCKAVFRHVWNRINAEKASGTL